MAKSEDSEKSWRIFRRRPAGNAFVGIVQAPNAEAAIQKAIKQFGITDPKEQVRLNAQPRDL
jgi:hypothetical protein